MFRTKMRKMLSVQIFMGLTVYRLNPQQTSALFECKELLIKASNDKLVQSKIHYFKILNLKKFEGVGCSISAHLFHFITLTAFKEDHKLNLHQKVLISSGIENNMMIVLLEDWLVRQGLSTPPHPHPSQIIPSYWFCFKQWRRMEKTTKIRYKYIYRERSREKLFSCSVREKLWKVELTARHFVAVGIFRK